MRLPGPIAKMFRLGIHLDKDSTIRGYNESDHSITLRVPYVYQEHVNLCTDASAMMILLAWGYTRNRTTKNNPRRPFQGSSIASHTDLWDYGELTWKVGHVNPDKKLPFFMNLLQTRGPIGVETKGHAQVLIGIDSKENTVILHDPWKGPNKVNKFEKFIKETVDYTWLVKVGTKELTPDTSTWKS